jgi:hypothetical protein
MYGIVEYRGIITLAIALIFLDRSGTLLVEVRPILLSHCLARCLHNQATNENESPLGLFL